MNLPHRLAKPSVGSCLTGWFLAYMSFAIPFGRLRETDTLLAFHHPKPAAPLHVIILPKKDIRSFEELDPADLFLTDLVNVVQSLVAEFHLPAYRLVVNDGEYQEFPHLHLHLISEHLTPYPLTLTP